MSHLPPLAQPAPAAPPAVTPPAAPPAPLGVPAPPKKGRSAPIWAFAIMLVLLVALIAYVLTFLGATASAVGMVLAPIPLAGVLLAVRIADRWEPEPVSLVIFALAWGAVVAVGIALALLVGGGIELVRRLRAGRAASIGAVSPTVPAATDA